MIEDRAHTAAKGLVTRQADTADIAAIRALLAAANLPTADIGEREAAWFIVALDADLVVGTVAIEPSGSFGLLRSLAVRPDWRAQGIGRRLVAASEARAAQARLRGIYLLTTTAEPFFRALGYDELEHWELPEEIRGTEEFRTLCPKTAAAMMKRLR